MAQYDITTNVWVTIPDDVPWYPIDDNHGYAITISYMRNISQKRCRIIISPMTMPYDMQQDFIK